MSAHYSKYSLNTYRETPFFQAQVPREYPLALVMQKCRAFRKLPPNVRKLAGLAKKWAAKNGAEPLGIRDWYDQDGYELDPDTRKRLTDKQLDQEWEPWKRPDVKVQDIPIPPGGFADPDEWEPSKPAEPVDERYVPSEEQLRRDIASHGREATAREYGIPIEKLPADRSAPMSLGDDVPEVVSTPELMLAGASVPVIDSSARGPFPKSNDRKDSPDTVAQFRVDRDWDDLKATVVGTIENNVFAPVPWQPSVKGLPKEGGVSYEEFAPKEYAKAMQQLDALCELLEKEKVQVRRPPSVTIEEAMQHPVGNTQLYVREAFSVLGETVVINQARSPYRRKEARAIETLFPNVPLVRLPTAPVDLPDSDPDDPNAYLEGGDVYRLGAEGIITLSGLASSGAGYRFVADLMAERGMDFWPAYLKPQWEHGDYILMLIREGLCLACRTAFVDDLLPSPITDWDRVEITATEADPGMAANGIVLRKNLVVVQRGNPRVVRALEKKGVDVIEVAFDGVSFFQGSVDCATNELRRG